jgi:rhamnose utilization protein RhaD (predicted bifunctional aldolase and dehydrogenase)
MISIANIGAGIARAFPARSIDAGSRFRQHGAFGPESWPDHFLDMQSLWNSEDAANGGSDVLAQRVYSSRLLGRESALVLHGGGNTSAKATVRNFLGDEVEVLFIKGSGGNLATLGAEGFPAVKLDVLLRLAELPSLTDTEMVRQQRAAMLDPSGPNPIPTP